MGKWKPRPAPRRASVNAPDGVERAVAKAATALASVGTTATPRRTPGNRVAASAIIVELMAPIRRLVDIPEEKQPMETLALLCSAAWNVSRLVIRGDDSQAEVEAARRKVAEMEPEFAPVFEAVLSRARKMYPEDRRLIMSVTVDMIGRGEMRVNAASVGGDD